MKKILLLIGISALALLLIGCGAKKEAISFSAEDINTKFVAVDAPDKIGVTKELSEDKQTITLKPGSEGVDWAFGVQSPVIKVDVKRNPVVLVKVHGLDGGKWTAKFLPKEKLTDDEKWGYYLVGNNDVREKSVAGGELKAKLGDSYFTLHNNNDEVEGSIWLWAADGSKSVTVEWIKVVYTK